MKLAATLVVFAVLVVPASATLVADPPVLIATGAPSGTVDGHPRNFTSGTARLSRTGGAFFYWGSTDGLHLARQNAAGEWGPSESLIALSCDCLGWEPIAGPTGTAGVLWTRTEATEECCSNTRSTFFMPLLPDGTFGESEPIAVPEGVYPKPGGTRSLADGTLVMVAFGPRQPDGAWDLVALERRPDGSLSAPKTLGRSVHSLIGVVPAGDRLVVMWSAPRPGGPPGTGERLLSAERSADGAWTDPIAVGDLSRDNAEIGSSTLLGDDAGDAYAVTNSAPPGHAMSPDSIDVTGRSAAGAWGPSVPVGRGFTRASAALSPNGTLAVVWSENDMLQYLVRHPDGRIERAAASNLRVPSANTTPVAVDDEGRVALLYQGPGFGGEGLNLYVRDPGSCFVRQRQLSPPGQEGIGPEITLRGDGSGLVTWADTDGTVHASTLRSVAVPVLAPCGRTGSGAAGPASVTLALSAPHRVNRTRLARGGLRVTVDVSADVQLKLVLTGIRGSRSRTVARRVAAVGAGHHVIRLPLRHAVAPRMRRLRLQAVAQAPLSSATSTVVIPIRR